MLAWLQRRYERQATRRVEQLIGHEFIRAARFEGATPELIVHDVQLAVRRHRKGIEAELDRPKYRSAHAVLDRLGWP